MGAIYFPTYREEMKKVDWGELYRKHGTQDLDENPFEKEVDRLMKNETGEIQRKQGIYAYVLTGDEKHLNLRTFNSDQKRTVYEQQEKICPGCCAEFGISEMEADHKKPWTDGGKTIIENCEMVCTVCHKQRTGEQAKRKLKK